MKLVPIILTFFLSITIYSQKSKSTKLGLATKKELQMKVYDKDSTAIAVVLYEHANIYLDKKHDNNTRTDYYYRIKILDKSAFDLANIEVNLYKKKKIVDIKGLTYNLNDAGLIKTTSLKKENIFEVNESENWKSSRFTMPNIKIGSVIEYSYSVISPYLGLDDWYFQSNIPKVKSELNAAILGNYKYNIRLVGYLKLDKDDASVKKDCIYIDGLGQGACVLYSYGMNNIPAFEEEKYMLSKKNYLSRISFDLSTYTSPRGQVEKYTTTWKVADKKLKKIFLNNQTSKKSFFKKRIPERILLNSNSLERAKAVYHFIQNHYTWNEKYWSNKDEHVKKAYNNKVGSAGEINLSLYNSLIAANIDANLIILSTRGNGVPTTLYPIIFDFNYVIIKAKIEGKEYLLDATNKFLPFGQIPERCLNDRARIINFKEESNWTRLNPKYKSSRNYSAKLELSEEGELNGNLLIRESGYFAIDKREELNTITEENYLEEFESNNSDIEVENYKVNDLKELDKPILEEFKIKITLEEKLDKTFRINPFLFGSINKNPFNLKERNYPVDFGFSRRKNQILNLKIPDNYTVINMPESVIFSLPNKGGRYILKSTLKGNIINIYTRMITTKKVYSVDEYYALKEFFNKIISAEKSYITIKRK